MLGGYKVYLCIMWPQGVFVCYMATRSICVLYDHEVSLCVIWPQGVFVCYMAMKCLCVLYPQSVFVCCMTTMCTYSVRSRDTYFMHYA